MLTTLKKEQAHTNPCRTKNLSAIKKYPVFYVKFSPHIFPRCTFFSIFLRFPRISFRRYKPLQIVTIKFSPFCAIPSLTDSCLTPALQLKRYN